MAFDFEGTMTAMLDAAAAELAEQSDEVQAAISQVVEDEREALRMIAEARLADEISEEEMESELEDEKLVMDAAAAMIRAVTKSAAQKAINAAVDTLRDAVAAALPGGR